MFRVLVYYQQLYIIGKTKAEVIKEKWSGMFLRHPVSAKHNN
jgi:hypothetical protein